MWISCVYFYDIPLHLPFSQAVPLGHAGSLAEHWQDIDTISQYGAVKLPLQELPSPHLHALLLWSQISFVAHASKEEVHLHRLFAASQTAPVASPAQVGVVPHLHTPLSQVSGDMQAF